MTTPARLALLGLLAIAGCADSGSESESYAVLRDDGWSLQEAVDPPQDDQVASAERPPMDWYAEYVRTVSGGAEGQTVRLSGHSASIAESQAALEAVGWELDTLALDAWDGVGGSSPEDPASPAVVLLEHGSRTLMLLSYELAVDEVASVAGLVEGVDEARWDASDGVIR